MLEASSRIRPHPSPCSQALSSPSIPAVGDQEYSALAFDWGTVSSAAPGLFSLVTEARARREPQEEEGKAAPRPSSTSASPAAFWDGMPCGSESSSRSPGGSALLGSVEGGAGGLHTQIVLCCSLCPAFLGLHIWVK